MTTKRVPLRRRVRGELSGDQEMELWLGSGRAGSLFADEDECRAAWQRHRTRIMVTHARDGRRPLAWWHFDAPIEFPGPDRERSTLYEAGLLEADERADLVVWWRSEFVRASRPGFTYCTGPDRWLTGVAARRAHYEWADIPRSLLCEWSAAAPEAVA